MVPCHRALASTSDLRMGICLACAGDGGSNASITSQKAGESKLLSWKTRRHGKASQKAWESMGKQPLGALALGMLRTMTAIQPPGILPQCSACLFSAPLSPLGNEHRSSCVLPPPLDSSQPPTPLCSLAFSPRPPCPRKRCPPGHR